MCDRTPQLDFDAFWGKDSTAELYHFIGKDIVNFHTLFWRDARGRGLPQADRG